MYKNGAGSLDPELEKENSRQSGRVAIANVSEMVRLEKGKPSFVRVHRSRSGKVHLVDDSHVVVSQLSGSNGEWTNGDDMGKKNRGLKKFGAALGKVALKVGTEMIKEAAASGTYDLAKVKQVQKKKKSSLKLRGSGFYSRGVSGSGTYVAGPNSTAQNELFGRTSRTNIVHAGDETDAIYVERIEREVISVYSPSTPAAFQLISVPVNPAQSSYSFLSGIAPNYSEYAIVDRVGDGGLIAFYEPAINETSAAVTAGQVGLWMSPNVNDAPPSNSTALVGSHGAISGMPSVHLACGFECDTRKGADGRIFNTRPGALPAGADLQEYDPCVLYIWTRGIPAATYPAGTLLGYVHVYWRIKLLKPRIYGSIGYSALVDTFYASAGLGMTNFTGTALMKGRNNGIGGDLDTLTYTFPDNFAGTVLVMIFIKGTGMTGSTGLTGAGLATARNCVWNGGIWTNQSSANTSATVVRYGVFDVQTALSAGANKVLFTALTAATTVDSVQIFVQMMSPNVASQTDYITA